MENVVDKLCSSGSKLHCRVYYFCCSFANFYLFNHCHRQSYFHVLLFKKLFFKNYKYVKNIHRFLSMWQCRSSYILINTTNNIVCIYSIYKIYWREAPYKTVPKGSLLNVSEKCISSM